MKIIYYFQELGSPMFNWQRIHFIDEMSRYGCEFDTFNPLLCNSVLEANEQLLEKVKRGNYDLFLTNLCSPLMIYKETIQEIKKMGIPTCSFRSDNLMIPFNDEELASTFDLVWLTSVETQHLYKEWGAKTVFLPYAANPYRFAPDFNKSIRRSCFIGTPHGSRPKMLNALSDNGVNIDIFCKPNPLLTNEKIQVRYQPKHHGALRLFYNKARHAEGRKLILASFMQKFAKAMVLHENESVEYFPKVLDADMPKIYSHYSLALSSTSAQKTDVLKEPLMIVNLRNFEIPMSGGIQFCRYNKEMSSYFEDGKEIVFYHSDEELIDKGRYYTQIASEAEILSMKKAARAKAEAEHSWAKRFQIVFKELGLR